MGDVDLKSIYLSTFFGAASSSCSFVALAAAQSLVKKGVHFIAAVAIMFAYTQLL
ncbi:MAG: permease [Balneolaceae bacterium]|nr:permease [Balneolaceae bacterium]